MDYFACLITAAVVALFGWYAWRTVYLRWRGIATTGTITALVRTADGDGVLYAPRVAFITREGIRIEVTSLLGTQEAGDYFRVGKQVRIRYSPTNPHCFAISGYEITSVLFLFLFAGMTVGVLWLLTRS